MMNTIFNRSHCYLMVTLLVAILGTAASAAPPSSPLIKSLGSESPPDSSVQEAGSKAYPQDTSRFGDAELADLVGSQPERLFQRAATGGFGFDDFGGSSDDLFFDSRDSVDVSVVVDRPEAAPGSDLAVAVIFQMEPKWHIWTNDPTKVPDGFAVFDGAIGSAITVDVPEDAPLVVHDFMVWPEHHSVEADIEGTGVPQMYSVFEGRAAVYIPITISPDAAPGTVRIPFKLSYQACDETTCKAPVTDQELILEITITDQPAAIALPADLANFPSDLFPRIHAGDVPAEVLEFSLFGFSFRVDVSTSFGFVLGLLVAALGGFLLNLTPCVLPVIPIKIMGLSRHGGHRSRTLLLGVFMAAGVIGFWIAIGVAIAGISSFTAINQLFQYPMFSISLGAFIALMAIGMCGLFAIRLPNFVYSVSPSQDSMTGSFGFGIMTAVLSTPCTAPFMGVAAAWAATQSASVTLTFFGAIGVGMASPYLVLAAFPQLINRMPRTGPGSELIKQMMGLLMLAAAVYFIGVGLSAMVANPADPPHRAYLWAVALCVAGAGAWLAFKTIRITPSMPRRALFGGLGVAMVVMAGVMGARLTEKGPIQWIYYTPDRLATARDSNQVVVMEFTAEWCLNCKALEQSVLRSQRIASLLNSDGIAPIKVDLTGNAADGNAMLKEVGRLTIPLLVVFDRSGNQVFSKDFYTVEEVLAALEQAGATAVARAD